MSQSDYIKSLIKDLTPVEIFDYYDGPRFYSCQDKLGHLFLIYWIDEVEDYDSWLYLRVSQRRYLSLKNGDISVADVLSNPEEGFAFFVKNYDHDFLVEEIPSIDVQADWLPPNDYCLNLQDAVLPSKTLPEKTLSAVELANLSSRQVLDIALNKLDNEYEMGCGKLGKLLNSFQSLIYALSCDKHFDSDKIPESIQFKSEVLVTGLFASSFGIRLQSKVGDVFFNDPTADAIENFGYLISKLSDSENILSEIRQLNIPARKRFKLFLQALVNSNVSIKLDWGSPSGKALQSQATTAEIGRVLRQLETDKTAEPSIDKRATLVGVNVESKHFTLKLDNDETINGTLSESISTQCFDVPCQIIAKLERSLKIDSLTDKEVWSYILVSFEKQT